MLKLNIIIKLSKILVLKILRTKNNKVGYNNNGSILNLKNINKRETN